MPLALCLPTSALWRVLQNTAGRYNYCTPVPNLQRGIEAAVRSKLAPIASRVLGRPHGEALPNGQHTVMGCFIVSCVMSKVHNSLEDVFTP